MRVLIAAAGSRGDFQPMLALAVALSRAGHAPLLAAQPNFAPEAGAFGVAFQAMGRDVEEFIRSERLRFGDNPFTFARFVFRAFREEMVDQFRLLAPLAKQADVVMGAGAALAGGSVAEAAGIPYRHVAYTPQLLGPTGEYPPVMYPFTRTPRWINRLLWKAQTRSFDWLLKKRMNEERAAIGLAPVAHVIPERLNVDDFIVAADPEVFAPPADLRLDPIGSFSLPDARPLPEDVEAFLGAGAPPVYVGFGSMPDAAPDSTTRTLCEAARRVGCRLVLSSGWAGLGGMDLGPAIKLAGPLSHALLFPRVAGVVHHGGAGTTHAAARAGVPQLIVPHAFDQFQFGFRVAKNGLGPPPIPKSKLTVDRLAGALRTLITDARMSQNARTAGERIRGRDALSAAVRLLESLAPTAPMAAPPLRSAERTG